MTKEAKSRYFTFIVYPDSAPVDWVERLEVTDIPMAISPLHDKDKKEGEEKGVKKPHYHVIYIAANPVTPGAVRNRIARAFGTRKAVNTVQIIQRGLESMYLYLTHQSKDAIAKKKYVYNKQDIKLINNFDIDRYITLDTVGKKTILRQIKDFIINYNCRNIVDFEMKYNLYGEKAGLPGLAQIDDVVDSYSGVLRLYFDGVYQVLIESDKN